MAVRGHLQDIPLTTLISVNCNEYKQSKLRIWDRDREASIFFEQGQIVHIELDGQQGEGALYELLTWEEGQFELEMDVPAPAHTVSTPWSNLVLEGMRLIDEREAACPVWDEVELTDEQPVIENDGVGDGDTAESIEVQETSISTETMPKEGKKMAKRRSEVLTEHLESLLRESADIHGAVIVGTDGLVLSSNLPMGGHDATRVGAEGAALVGLSKRALGNLKCGDFKVAILQGKDGWVIVSGAGPQAMVLGLTEPSVNLGMALLEMRDIANDVAETMT